MRIVLVLLLLSVPSGGAAPLRLDAPRAAHTASLLPDGRVLIVGGCTGSSCDVGPSSWTTELFDPRTGATTPGPTLDHARLGHVAATLRDGSVLLAGGWDEHGVTASAELYADGRVALAGSMRTARGGATATRLHDGRVLIAGGVSAGRSLATAEVYDPATRRFSVVGPMRSPRDAHAAVLLRDGRVLVAGGANGRRVLSSAEIFDPRTNRFRAVGPMASTRHKLAAAPLPDGGALVLGGSDARDFDGRHRTAERFDPRSNRFVRAGALVERRFKNADAVAVLASGEIVVGGGAPSIEVYDPKSGRFRIADGFDGERYFATATALTDGRVLVAGGYDGDIAVSDRMWLFAP